MSNRVDKNGFEMLTISSRDHSAHATFIPARGATIASIIMPSCGELLYLHDFFWDQAIDDLPGGMPFIFPICARVSRQGKFGDYLFDGNIYNLKIHGFSWYLPWEVLNEVADSVTFVLRDSEETRLRYPFSFEVRLKYKIDSQQLTCQQTYINNSQKPMPYYAGFHPYFLTPPVGHGKEAVCLNYSPIRRFQYNDDYTDLRGECDLFKLPTSVANPEINEQLTEVGEDKSIELAFPQGHRLHMTTQDAKYPDLFPYVQIYTMVDKPFICVESWMSFPNAMNTVSGVRWLPPAQREVSILKLTVNK